MTTTPGVLTLLEQARRREAFRQLEALAERIRARNTDLTSEEAEQLADEISRETIQRMMVDGMIRFRS